MAKRAFDRVTPPLFPSSSTSTEFEQTVRTKNERRNMFSINPESFAPRKKKCIPTLLSLLPAPNEYQFFAIALSSREQQKKEQQQYRPASRPAGYNVDKYEEIQEWQATHPGVVMEDMSHKSSECVIPLLMVLLVLLQVYAQN